MNWVIDIGLVVATILVMRLLLMDKLPAKRWEKIFAVVVGIVYFVLLGLLCRQIYALSQFPPMMEMQ